MRYRQAYARVRVLRNLMGLKAQDILSHYALCIGCTVSDLAADRKRREPEGVPSGSQLSPPTGLRDAAGLRSFRIPGEAQGKPTANSPGRS
jgi:hypothetical protein